MGAWWLALMVASFSLAGCSDLLPGDSSHEAFHVDVTAAGPFVIGVPLRVSTEGATVGDWLACAEAPDGWSFRLDESERGTVLEVTGRGTGQVTSCASERRSQDITEHYLDAQWTTTPTNATQPRAEALWVWSDTSGVHATLTYSAESKYCGMTGRFQGALDVGWTALAGSEEAVCS